MIQPALKELIDRGCEIANAQNTAKAPVKVDIPSDGRQAHFRINGELKAFDVPPPLRDHHVDSVADLCFAAKRWNTDPVLWIADRRVVLVIDDADRRETVTLQLVHSAVFLKLLELRNIPKLEQAALIRLLRAEFRNAADVSNLLASVRKIKFRSHSEGYSDIQHGNESLGQSVENEVSGAGEIDQIVTVSTNLYNNPGETDQRYTIGLDLEVNAKDRNFTLRPMPDEIELATAMALAGIRERIAQVIPGVPVFFGVPFGKRG